MPDNQVMIGGSPVGTVSSIELSPNNLAEVNVEVEQELHEGTTAVIRATSLSGVANHYVSISPGPNSSPALEEGAELGLASTTTPVDIDQLFNSFPPKVREGLQNFIKGNAQIYAGRGKDANESYKYFGTALNRATAFAAELNADEQLLSKFLVSSSNLTSAVAGRGEQLSSAISNANTAFKAISSQNAALDTVAAGAAAGPAPVEHDLRQPAGGARRRRTADQHRQAGDQEPRPVPRRTAPGAEQVHPLHPEPQPGARPARASTTTPPNCCATLPERPAARLEHLPARRDAIAAFQPQLNFIRSYTPDIFNGIAKLGQVSGYYDGNGHYVRGATSLAEHLPRRKRRTERRSRRSEQFVPFGEPTATPRRCPGGAAQAPADNSAPYVNPPHSGSSVTASECNSSQAVGGP